MHMSVDPLASFRRPDFTEIDHERVMFPKRYRAWRNLMLARLMKIVVLLIMLIFIGSWLSGWTFRGGSDSLNEL